MLDIGVVLQAPMEDERWLKKCAIMGLITFALMFVPLVGAFIGTFNLIGWMRTYAETRMNGGKDLPEPGVSYLSGGWQVFLSYLPLAGVILALVIVIAGVVGVGAATESEPVIIIGAAVGAVTFVPFMLWVTVFNPGMLYLHIVKGEPWASMRLGAQWNLASTMGTEYLLLWVAFLVAGVISQLGMLACGVGLIVSMVYGYAMQGVAIAEFARIARERGA